MSPRREVSVKIPGETDPPLKPAAQAG